MKQILPIKTTLVLLLAHLLLSFNIIAQEIEVTGKVMDEKGTPLVGANIIIKGTSVGTISDSTGEFTIKTSISDFLIITYVGYKTLEFRVDNNRVEARLVPGGRSDLNEVIINCSCESYFDLINRCPTIALSQEELQFVKGNIYHPYQLIRGRVAGLTISKPGGDPLGTYDVYQRGQHSLYNTDPLVVIDGLPGASLQTLDVQDIESITILRDAFSTSVYGTRGANGVIEIKSKVNYWEEKLKVSYSGYASLENVIKTPNVLDANQFRSIVNDASSRFYNPAADFGATTDWAKEITRTGLSQAHNLAFRGGSKNTKYNVSLNYRAVNGVVKGSGFDQSNALLNVSQDLFKNKVRLTANTAITHRNFTEIDKDIFYYAAVFNPTAPIRTDTGYFQQALFDYQNPVALLEQIDNQGKQTIYTTNLNGRWDIVKDLRAQVNYGFQQQHYNRYYKINQNTYPNRYNYSSKLDLSNQSLQTSLSYNPYIDRHSFQLTGGYQYQEWTNNLYNPDDYDLAVNGLHFASVNFNAQRDSFATAYKTKTELAAFFGRLQYDFDNWLFFNANWRLEGSTRFGANNKWGNFYGFGASVNFAELINVSFINYLKARISYGVAGNLPVDGVYANLTFQPSGRTLYNGNFIDVYSPATNANPNLKWEARREWNVGLDADFFNHRLSTSIELYRGRSEDMINAYYPSNPPNLAPLTYANFVEFENRGVEIMVNARLLQQSNFSWEFGLNYASNRATFSSATTPQGQEINRIAPSAYLGIPGFCCSQFIVLEQDKPLGRFVGPEFKSFENGQAVFKDQNNDGKIDAADEVELGNALPNYTFGIMNELRWNKLEFSFFLRGVMGHSMVNTHALAFSYVGNLPRYNVLQTALEAPQNKVLNASRFSSYNVEKASFATLENLVIGYHFNPQKRYLSALKVYAAAQNLFTLSSYSGGDPEVRLKNRGGNFHTGNALVPGLDVRVGYYSTRTFTLGVQAEF